MSGNRATDPCETCITLRGSLRDAHSNNARLWKENAALTNELAIRTEAIKREGEDLRNWLLAGESAQRALEATRARVAALMQIIETAPHGSALKPCAVDHYDPETYMDDPLPCDCWKSRAEVKG